MLRLPILQLEEEHDDAGSRDKAQMEFPAKTGPLGSPLVR
jgi:hypothetical protein